MITLNPADKSANITLSGGDLIATAAVGGEWIGARGTMFHQIGELNRYFEATIVTKTSYIIVGVATSAFVFSGGGVMGVNGGFYKSLGHDIISSDSVNASFTDMAQGDIFGVATEASTKIIRIYKNGTVSTTYPAALSSSLFTPFLLLFAAGDSVQFNFDETTMTYLPSGYKGWDYEPRQSRPATSTIARPRPFNFIGL